MHPKACGSDVANHEQAHGDDGDQQLVVAFEQFDQVLQARLLFRLEGVALLPDPQQGEQLKQQHQYRRAAGEHEPGGLGAAKALGERLGHRQDAHHHGVHPDVGADAGKGADALALHRVDGQGGQHGPVGDVIGAKGQVPAQVEQGEHDEVGRLGQAKVIEHEHHEQAAQDGAKQHQGLELAVPAPGVVHHNAHHRVIEGVKYAQHRQNQGHPPHGAVWQVQDVRQVVDEVGGHRGIKHVPADGAQAEEEPVFLKLVHQGALLCLPLILPQSRHLMIYWAY